MTDDPSWRLSDDRKTLVAVFPGDPPSRLELDAAETDRLTRRLSELRIVMEPPIPLRDPSAGEQMTIIPKGRWWVQPDLVTGGIVLALLHPGYGWIGLQLDQDRTSQLVQRIAQQRPSMAPSAKTPAN
jgi:hypothetical protein